MSKEVLKNREVFPKQSHPCRIFDYKLTFEVAGYPFVIFSTNNDLFANI